MTVQRLDFRRMAPVELIKPSGQAIPFGIGASSDGERGAALINAVNTAVSGDVVKIGAGTFELDEAIVLDTDGVTIRGAGRGTVLDFATNNIGNMSIRLYADDLTVGNFTLLTTTGGYPGIGYLTSEAGYPSSPATGFLIHDIDVTGGPDQIMFYSDDTAFTGVVRDCTFTQTSGNDPVIDLGAAAGANIVFERCVIKQSHEMSILMQGTGGALTIKDSSIDKQLIQDGGTTVTVQNVDYDPAQAVGVITDVFAVSPFGRRSVTIPVSDFASDLTTGDGKNYWRVPATLDGWNIVAVAAHVTTASSSGTPTFQIHNVTDSVDVLSTALTIDANEKDSSTAATPAVINTSNDSVATADELRIDCDVAGTGTKGASVELTFERP